MKATPLVDHKTTLGTYFVGNAEEALDSELLDECRGQVQLILTSPPFPLNHKKRYGNKTGQHYVRWFASLAPIFAELLANDGSIVVEIGNSWLPGRPVQSLLGIEALLKFVKNKDAKLRLCQEFVCYNPARMPSPAQWVTVERSRVTDSFTHVWWMAKTDHPKADNRRVLRPYSSSMKKLLETRRFNRGWRPSGFHVGERAFLNENAGSIAHNFFEIDQLDEGRKPRLPNAFSFANTSSSDHFSKACRENNIEPHPARMPTGLANFFVQFLSEPGDLVLDPFAGSNTTGFVAELNDRRWLAIEQNGEYAVQSRLRFEDPFQEGRDDHLDLVVAQVSTDRAITLPITQI